MFTLTTLEIRNRSFLVDSKILTGEEKERGKKEQTLVVRPPTVQPNKKYTEDGSERGNFNPRCVYENE